MLDIIIQHRHNLRTTRIASKRDINERAFVEEARPPWIATERAERRRLKIIISKPEGYDENPEMWNVIWPDDVDEIWEGERELNEDEIPFTIDCKRKQMVRFGEKSRLIKNKISYIGKYRQGTIAMVMNFKRILFVIIIFKKGGVGVTRQLKKMGGHAKHPVYLFCTESGSMTAAVWLKTMILVQNATKNMRRCNQVQKYNFC